MPAPRLEVDWRSCQAETRKLQSLIGSLAALPPAHRKLVAEIVMVRLFLLVENSIASVAYKALCGSPYLDGSLAIRLVTPSTVAAARSLISTHGRAKPRQNLNWMKAKDIRDNLEFTLDPSDTFFVVVSQHAQLISEMRFVRNHISHKNTGTRKNFHKVVRRHYGGLKPGMTPGLLLISERLSVPTILERYIVSARVLVKDLVRA